MTDETPPAVSKVRGVRATTPAPRDTGATARSCSLLQHRKMARAISRMSARRTGRLPALITATTAVLVAVHHLNVNVNALSACRDGRSTFLPHITRRASVVPTTDRPPSLDWAVTPVHPCLVGGQRRAHVFAEPGDRPPSQLQRKTWRAHSDEGRRRQPAWSSVGEPGP